jgi:sulfur relay (sulfurtransferase) complex TusBCD TusD component (DsrE family)
MKYLITVFLVAPLLLSCEVTSSEQKATAASSELIINLTSDATKSAHGSLMGIHLAENALDNGLDVMVFLNVNGVKLLQPGADTLVFHGENILQALDKVVEKGGEVRVCPHCAEALGVDKSQIPAKFKMQEEKAMMDKLKNNPTVFTY